MVEDAPPPADDDAPAPTPPGVGRADLPPGDEVAPAPVATSAPLAAPAPPGAGDVDLPPIFGVSAPPPAAPVTSVTSGAGGVDLPPVFDVSSPPASSPARAGAPADPPAPSPADPRVSTSGRRRRSERLSASSSRLRLLDQPSAPRRGAWLAAAAGLLLVGALGGALAWSARATAFVPRSWPELEAHVDALTREGRYAEALAALEACPPAIRRVATEEFLARRAAPLRRYQAFHEELRAALAGGPSRRLKELVVGLERYQVEPELRELAVVAPWKERAREVLGAQAYEDLAVFGIEEDQPPTPTPTPTSTPTSTPTPTPTPTPTSAGPGSLPPAPTLARIDDPARRAALEAATRRALEHVAACRARLAAREEAAAARVAAEGARALADPRALRLPRARGPAGGGVVGRLVEYGARRFSVAVTAGDVRRFTWSDAPPALACDVLERALDLDDAQGRRRVALAALRGGLLERAAEHLDAARRLDPSLPLPDLEALRPLARVLRGQGTVAVAGAALEYAFDDPAELRDVTAAPYTDVRLDAGDLVVASSLLRLQELARASGRDLPAEAAVGFAALAGRWRGPLELELELATPRADLLVGLGSQAVIAVGAGGATWGPWSALSALETKGAWTPGAPLRLGVWRLGDDRARVVVKQGAASLLEEVLPVSWPLDVVLGARGGPVRVQRLRLEGAPDETWLQAASDRLPFDLEVALDAWRAKVEAAAQASAGGLPPLAPHLDVTSAEDEVALADVPAGARELVGHARRWLRLGRRDEATDLTRRAIAGGRGRYWAAEYLLAQLELEARPDHAAGLEGPRIRLDQAIAAVDGFFEALAARSRVHLEAGRLEAARADADAALALRADHAPARLARAYVAVQEGDLQRAVDEARLAAELAGSPGWAVYAEQLEALRDGPPWSAPVTRESANYRVTTDMPGRADAFLATLEATRALAPDVFPCLASRPGAPIRVGRVLLFSRAEDYHRHAYRTTGDRKEATAGYFSPRSGTLHIYDSADGHEQTLRVLRHEATHQWVHTLGLELPYWANEALADYLGGYDPRARKSRPDRRQLQALLAGRERLRGLFDLMTLSPAEFYSGDVYLQYAQAWSFVHCCMEGPDPRLRRALFDYLAQHGQGQAGDRSRQAGVSLEHIYAATFHRLGLRSVERAWWEHVERLSRQ